MTADERRSEGMNTDDSKRSKKRLDHCASFDKLRKRVDFGGIKKVPHAELVEARTTFVPDSNPCSSLLICVHLRSFFFLLCASASLR